MKVLFLSYIPAPYRVDFFNELGKRCELTVIFEKKTAGHRDQSWFSSDNRNYQCIFLSDGDSKNNIPKMSVIQHLNSKKYDAIIVHNISTATGILAILYLKIMKIPYYLESDGGFVKDENSTKAKLKKFLMRGAKGYFSTSKSCDEYFLKYGAKVDKLIRYPFTSLSKEDIEHGRIAIESMPDKQTIRKELNMSEERIILSVGQFIHRKGFDVLLRAMKECKNEYGVYIVGGVPTEEFRNLQEKLALEHVHFVGFMGKKELSEYYLASDLFVIPTREDIWGLVVNEAMCYGLPVITTERCGAGQELVINDRNGFLVPVDDVQQLAKRIDDCFDSDKLELFGRQSLEIIKNYSFTEMADYHIRAVQ